MALSEQEEFELLSLEREKANIQPSLLGRIGSAAVKGSMGPIPGPLGAIAGAVREVGGIQDETIGKAAYKAGGAVTDIASQAGLPPEAAAGAGYLTNVGIQAVPAVVGGKAASMGFAPVMQQGARRLMQSSIKPNAAARESGDSAKAIETMLQKGINATEGGMEATQTKVSALENKLQSILNQSPAMVDPLKAADNITKAVKAVGLNLERAKNISDIEKVYTKFINHEAIKDLGEIPVSLANKMKQAFYRELKDKAFVPGADLTASAKAQKALAEGLKQEVAAAEPAVIPTLAEQSELLNVLKVAGPQASREGNKNIIGLGALSPRLENVMVWMVDRYPWFKSLLARSMYSGSERLPQAVGGSLISGAEALPNRKSPD